MPWIEVWIDVLQNGYGAAATGVVTGALVLLKKRWYAATREHADSAWADLKTGE